MKVAITQRVEFIRDYNERRDCLDQAWCNLLSEISCDTIPIPNTISDVKRWVESVDIDAVLLTGGNDLSHLPSSTNLAPERDRLESELLRVASESNLPVLGVCRGMQMINQYLGGSLIPISEHSGKQHKIIINSYDEILGKRTTVNSFHNWGISKNCLADNLMILAEDENHFVEAFRHTTLPWIGIMWHPERDVEDMKAMNIKLLRNVFNLGNQKK